MIEKATIPEDLQRLSQWVVWKFETRQGKKTKVPFDARTGNRASTKNSSTWSSLELAASSESDGGFDGIGFVFSRSDPFCGIDLDDCIGEDHKIGPWAQKIIDRFNTYTEVSPSGRGVKLFLRGRIPPGGNRKGKIELYDRGRYFTVTTRHLEGTSLAVEDRQAELEAFHRELFTREVGRSRRDAPPIAIEDEELLRKARAAKNGEKFAALFDRGDTSAYGGDESAADFALCGMLAFWCGPDPERIDRLFRGSALIREKWDSRRGDGTYGARTIATVLAESREFYRGEGARILPFRANEEADCKRILADLGQLEEEPELSQLTELLRKLSAAVRGCDDLDRAATREAAIRALRRKVSSPASLIDAALQGAVAAPAEPDDAQGRRIALSDPELHPQPVNGGKLLGELARTFVRYVALPEGAATALALWTVHTYLLSATWISPLLTLSSPEKRCGKTTLLTVLFRLVRRPLPTSNVSPAALFRSIEAFEPTLLIDEADTFLRRSDELRGILNSGHTRQTAFVIRTAGDDHEPRSFSTWAAKAVALIGELPSTLADRSIVIPMRRKGPDDEVARLRQDCRDELEDLRRKVARWGEDHAETLREADPTAMRGLDDRAADNWHPLLAIAELAGGRWPSMAKEAARVLSGQDATDDSSAGIMLLEDLRAIFERRGESALASQDIVDELIEIEDRPWGEWRRGQPLTTIGLARLLKPFGVKPKQMRLSEKTRGYERAQFQDAFTRYLPPESVQPVQASPDAGLRDSSSRYRDAFVPTRECAPEPGGMRVVPSVPTQQREIFDE